MQQQASFAELDAVPRFIIDVQLEQQEVQRMLAQRQVRVCLLRQRQQVQHVAEQGVILVAALPGVDGKQVRRPRQHEQQRMHIGLGVATVAHAARQRRHPDHVMPAHQCDRTATVVTGRQVPTPGLPVILDMEQRPRRARRRPTLHERGDALVEQSVQVHPCVAGPVVHRRRSFIAVARVRCLPVRLFERAEVVFGQRARHPLLHALQGQHRLHVALDARADRQRIGLQAHHDRREEGIGNAERVEQQWAVVARQQAFPQRLQALQVVDNGRLLAQHARAHLGNVASMFIGKC